MRPFPGLAAAAVLATLTLASRGARSDQPALPVRLDFRGDAGCPVADSFLERIQLRAPVRPSGQAGALRLRVSLAVTPGGAFGELRAGDGDATDARQVTAASCSEAADALALIAALIVERTQREQAAQATAPRPAPQAPAPEPPTAQSKRPTIALGLAAVAARPVTGATLTGGSLSLLVDAGLTGWLAVGYARSDVLGGSGTARFGLGGVTLGVGLPTLSLGARFGLAVGALAQGAFLAAEGVQVDVPLSVRRSYWGVGLLGRLQWEAVDRGFVFTQASAVAPLVERRFSIREPYERVATTAVVAPEVAVGLALGL